MAKGADTAFVRNPNYHMARDTIDTLDFEKMAALVEMLKKGIRGTMTTGKRTRD